MPAPSFAAWLTGSDARRPAVEAAAALLLFAEAVAFLTVLADLPAFWLAVLWGQWLLCLVGLRLLGLFKVFGPVMAYELLRAARRMRYLIIRVVYLLVILLLAGWLYGVWLLSSRGWSIDPHQLAAFAYTFFATFMSVQFLAVVVLTPAYVAGAISEEKERKTLEFILATDLRDTEIVLGKLLSRLASVLFLVLAGLPVLSAFQYLGGVDPNLVAAGFAATLLLAASLGAVGIFASVSLRKSRDAIAVTYIVSAVYVAITLAAYSAVRVNLSWLTLPGTEGWLVPLTAVDLATWAGAGNPLLALGLIFEGGAALDETLPWVLRNYAIFHGSVALLLPLWATARMRRVALSERLGPTPRRGKVRWLFRPAVGSWPVLWKEVFVERGGYRWAGRIFGALLVLASVSPAVAILINELSDPWARPNYGWGGGDVFDRIGRQMNWWIRVVGPMVATLTLMGIGVRAAGTVTGEKARHTWDELLTTPLGSSEILFGKWFGSVISARWGVAWLVGLWLLAMLTGGVSPLALPLLVGAWLVYAALMASIGMAFSMRCANTLVATLLTLLTALVLTIGHWLLALVLVYLPASVLRTGGSGPLQELMRETLQWVVSVQFGLTPPVVLGMLAFRLEEFRFFDGWRSNDDWIVKVVGGQVIGMGVWVAAAVVLYLLNDQRFRALTNRIRLRPRPAPRRESPREAISTSV